ncbi:hypothetical protein ACFX19_033299 [Malus domestica]
MIHLVFFTFHADSRSDLHCSKTSSFVHQHLVSSVGNDTKSDVGSLSFFSSNLHRESAETQEPNTCRVTVKPMSSAPTLGHGSSVRNTTGYYRPANRADEISSVEL